MINLQETGVDIGKAKKTHQDFFVCYILSRLTKEAKCKKYLTSFPKKTKIHNADTFPFITNYIITNLLEILSGLPSDLEGLQIDFETKLDAEISRIYIDESFEVICDKRKDTITDLTSIIDYQGFFIKLEPRDDYSAYHLAKNLDVRSCVYCNRVFTITHNTKLKEKLMRPQFDHWFPKSDFPLLALSFFNLIPSCTHCNSSVKGNMVLDLNKHIHPYIEEEDDSFKFTYHYYNTLDEFEVSILKKGRGTKYKATLELLKIDEMYTSHQYEIKDLLKLRKAYTFEYLDKLKSSFKDANLTDEELYRLAFGTELKSKDFHKRPFSKFKYDILTELGIIKDEEH